MPESAPASDRRPRPTARLLLIAALAVLVGVGAGLLVGSRMATAKVDDADAAADRASEAEDAARDRRDLLDARLEYIDQQAGSLGEVVTDPPLFATDKSTKVTKFGEQFSVDGGDYVVNGIDVVDSFESADPSRPAKEVKGKRYVLVDVDYTNRTKESQAPACGTNQTIRVVLDDGTTVNELRHEPPVHKDTYDTCGNNLDPGASGHWVAPVLVPEGSQIEGVLVADVYARESGSEFNVRAGKVAWLPLKEPVDVGSSKED
jgi:hypothetical protein